MENKKTHSVAKIVASAAVAGVCTGVTTAILLQQNHDIDKENFSIGNNQNITAANDISILIPESTTIGNFQVEEYDEITEDMVKDRINDWCSYRGITIDWTQLVISPAHDDSTINITSITGSTVYSGVTYVDFSILHKQNLLKIFNITNTNLFLEQTNPSAQDIVNNLTQHGMYSSIWWNELNINYIENGVVNFSAKKSSQNYAGSVNLYFGSTINISGNADSLKHANDTVTFTVNLNNVANNTITWKYDSSKIPTQYVDTILDANNNSISFKLKSDYVLNDSIFTDISASINNINSNLYQITIEPAVSSSGTFNTFTPQPISYSVQPDQGAAYNVGIGNQLSSPVTAPIDTDITGLDYLKDNFNSILASSAYFNGSDNFSASTFHVVYSPSTSYNVTTHYWYQSGSSWERRAYRTLTYSYDYTFAWNFTTHTLSVSSINVTAKLSASWTSESGSWDSSKGHSGETDAGAYSVNLGANANRTHNTNLKYVLNPKL